MSHQNRAYEWPACCGHVMLSAYRPAVGLRPAYAAFDAERRFGLARYTTETASECISGLVLQGRKKPYKCPAFGTRCTPSVPLVPLWSPPKGRVPPTIAIVDCRVLLQPRRLREAEAWCQTPFLSVPTAGRLSPGTDGAGGGGHLMHQLLERLFLPAFRNPLLETRHDSAVLNMLACDWPLLQMPMLGQPLFFPGAILGRWPSMAR